MTARHKKKVGSRVCREENPHVQRNHLCSTWELWWASAESAPAVEAVAAQVEKVELGAGSDPDEIKKRLRNLTKKISQINKIKEKQEKGESLEPEQLEKLKTESELREEIARLEALS